MNTFHVAGGKHATKPTKPERREERWPVPRPAVTRPRAGARPCACCRSPTAAVPLRLSTATRGRDRPTRPRGRRDASGVWSRRLPGRRPDPRGPASAEKTLRSPRVRPDNAAPRETRDVGISVSGEDGPDSPAPGAPPGSRLTTWMFHDGREEPSSPTCSAADDGANTETRRPPAGPLATSGSLGDVRVLRKPPER